MEFVKECLDILDLMYTDLDDGSVGVSFFDEEVFPHQIITLIRITNDNALSFSSHSPEYHPQGDLYFLANRHNCRSHSPACHITEEGAVVMDRVFNLEVEVSPHYILEDVIRPSMYLPLEAFANFELDDDELQRRMDNLDNSAES